LKVSFEELVEETTRLNLLNSNLVTIVGFFNETSSAEDSLNNVTASLTEQIVTFRALVVDTLEISSQTQMIHWDCDYRDVYGERPYGSDFDVVIPPGDIEGLVSYVNQSILQDLCLSETKFRSYVQLTNPDGLTSNQLVTAVTTYVSAALEWYFPPADDNNEITTPGVSQDMWAEAGYHCQNLESQF
jgi:hypothetical protein